MRIKHYCKECDSIELYSTKELIFGTIFKIIMSVLVVLGLFVVILMVVAGPGEVFGNVAISSYLTANAIASDDLRAVSINATKGCVNDSTSSFCYTLELYDFLVNPENRDNRYVPSSLFNFVQDVDFVYDYSGDCKEVSVMFVAMMRSLGFKSRVDCDVDKGHCVAVIQNYNEYEKVDDDVFVVDLTGPLVIKIDEGDVWGYLDRGKFLRW